MISDWFEAVNLTTPGQIRVGLAGSAPIAAGGNLLTIDFAALGASGDSSTLQIDKGALNEGAVQVTLTDGRVDVVEARHTINMSAGWNMVSSPVNPIHPGSGKLASVAGPYSVQRW